MHLLVFQKRNYQVFWSSFGICPLQFRDWLYCGRAKIWSWSTTNTTTDICLLVKNCNKNTETKCKVCSNFFLSAVWTLSHWQGDNFTHLMLITMLFHVRSGGHQEPWNEVGSQSLTKGISGIWAGNLPIPSVTCNPTMSHYVMLIWQQYYSGKKH